jgi:hypothetical protein
MKQSDFLAHSDLEAQAMRRDALRRAMLNRPPERAQRASESRSPGANPWGRCFTVAFALVALAALLVVGCDVFIWRP